jgi:hypothetical protein
MVVATWNKNMTSEIVNAPFNNAFPILRDSCGSDRFFDVLPGDASTSETFCKKLGSRKTSTNRVWRISGPLLPKYLWDLKL